MYVTHKGDQSVRKMSDCCVQLRGLRPVYAHLMRCHRVVSQLGVPRSTTLLAVFVCGSLLGCGCQQRREPASMPFQDAPPFTSSGSAELADAWWTAFNDPLLDERVDRALRENFSLAAAWERLRQADAMARRARSDRSIDLDGTAGVGRTERDDGADDTTRFSLGLEASYEVDLWGRIDSAIEAERLRALASEADYKAAALTLSGEVAANWYTLVVARLQVQLIRSQLETNEKVLEVLERRFAVGQSGSADVLRQRQLVESTREQIMIAESLVEVLGHQQAILEGRAPQQEFAYPGSSLPSVPAAPSTGLPAELLRRRPDVIRAMYSLRAADEDVAVAVADTYPRIDLSASISTAAENPSALFSDWIANIAADAVMPILDGGERAAEVERARAEREELLADYAQTVLDAFGEVEIALSREREQSRRLSSLEAQLELARETYTQLRTQYLNGAADFIDVLTTLREQQQIERDLLDARLSLITFRIGLYRALAGGFETPREAGGASEDLTNGEESRG